MERTHELKVRRLARTDLDAVVALDAEITGRTRRAYFERRLAVALRQPELHVQFAAEAGGVLCGHALARVLEGEFGRTQPGLRLEVISVARAAQGKGAGRALHAALEAEAKKRSIGELRTSTAWRDHAMLRFLDAAGYALAPAEVLECALQGGAPGADEEPVVSPARDKPGDPNDWSAPSANDYEQLARDAAEIRLLSAHDLEDVVRIDRDFTGRERRAYMQHALDEALRESGIRISLAAIVDGHAVGFVMARADLGDFGRAEPVAVIDALGVSPAHAQRGIGRALLSQLFLNLGALRIERVETVVAVRNLELLGFLLGAGFARGQRLAFVKRLAG
ncbi:MAG: GNAT family N-acetyltransferase [Burkholderiales bacterium]|nr:GNAT family N-acetyltransferase [Burkholderiales bacterium]